ncbi:MAG: hypothetical protein H0X01_01250 [Nitrospira sp.]|nr:hypothetical protein [Nitrospira sp.]
MVPDWLYPVNWVDPGLEFLVYRGRHDHHQHSRSRNGETVAHTFAITYEMLNAPRDNHAHVYLDGIYQNEFKGTFTHVPKGEHTITVEIADHDHKDAFTATDTIKITVSE